MKELTAHQAECDRVSGHCWHRFADLLEEFEYCCCCALRRNEKAIAVQEGLPL